MTASHSQSAIGDAILVVSILLFFHFFIHIFTYSCLWLWNDLWWLFIWICPGNLLLRWFWMLSTVNRHDPGDLTALFVCVHLWSDLEFGKTIWYYCRFENIHDGPVRNGRDCTNLYFGCRRTDAQYECCFTFVHLWVEASFVIFGIGKCFTVRERFHCFGQILRPLRWTSQYVSAGKANSC